MVIFNKQGDTPDHPLRAARAALTLLRTADRVARPDWPRFRVGVNSGDGGRRGRRRRDRAPQARRRRRHGQRRCAARAGRRAVGRRDRRRRRTRGCRRRRVAERLPPLHVKGKAEPLEAYRLRRAGYGATHERADEQPARGRPQRGDRRVAGAGSRGERRRSGRSRGRLKLHQHPRRRVLVVGGRAPRRRRSRRGARRGSRARSTRTDRR